ncbi:MAG: GxxExxY protein [Treponema sp.]|nr:GxxExxY protein [Treponema sp.]
MDVNKVTEQIIGSAFEVSNTLGCGFLEKVYENALAKELRIKDLKVEQQKKISVFYKNENVGDYYADLCVEDDVIVEIKSIKQLAEIQEAQLINYLKATNKRLGLLINFGTPKVQIRRLVNNL